MGRMMRLAWIEQEIEKAAREMDYWSADLDVKEIRHRPTKRWPHYSLYEIQVTLYWDGDRSVGIFPGSETYNFTQILSSSTERQIMFRFTGLVTRVGLKQIISLPKDKDLLEAEITMIRKILDEEFTKFFTQSRM